MITPTSAFQNWPPFAVDQLPREVQPLFEDFQQAPLQPHPIVADPLVTVVVPCFNPDPLQFAQLLLSLYQQSDQAFDVLLVNDGSSYESWKQIEQQLLPHPWIQVLHQSANSGISSPLNTALDHLDSPYVAFVDQDDLLHPAAMALVRRHLERHPDCGLLYTDHITFDDRGTRCQYIPKFPWNPEALLEFNFLIHLTVVRADLYRACGGMDPHFDGIQDWDFYLRLSPLLTARTVSYLPIPLYAWRFSDSTFASSAKPKTFLLEKAQEFLSLAHSRNGAGTTVIFPKGGDHHYCFSVDRSSSAHSSAPQFCNLLLLAGDDSIESINYSLESLAACSLNISRLFLAVDNVDQLPKSTGFPVGHEIPKLEYLTCYLQELPDQLPVDKPLMILQSGAALHADSSYNDIFGWLERTDQWDVVTFPTFNGSTGPCISAGYSRVVEDLEFYFPNARGLSRKAYEENFASFSHTRAVDLPCPSIHLLRTSTLRETLDAIRRINPSASRSVCSSWWIQLTLSPWRCCCLPYPLAYLSPDLAMTQQRSLPLRKPSGVAFVTVEIWLSAAGNAWNPSYLSLLETILHTAPGRAHPLHVHSLVSGNLHPAILRSAELRSGRGTFLPPKVHRPLIILIPTELNARSNGHACLLTLALKLQEAGHKVYLLPYKPYIFYRNYLPNLPSIYRCLSFIVNPLEVPDAVLLVPESAPKRLVQRLRPLVNSVLWWLLAPSGLLTIDRPPIRLGDLLVAFSEFAFPGQKRYLFVHPKEHPELLRNRNVYTPAPPSRLQVAIYTGKGRLKPLSRSMHRHLLGYNVVLITRSFPASKGSLIRLLEKCNGLISFDPLTNLCLEAASLGLPVFLRNNPFPLSAYQRFPVNLVPFILDSPEAFISRLRDRGPLRKLSTRPLDQVNSHAVEFIKSITAVDEPFEVSSIKVSSQTLDDLDSYCSELVRSKSILAARQGEALSSALSDYYVSSLKATYLQHRLFCAFLFLIDGIGDLLVSLHLLPALMPLINIILLLIRKNASRARKIVRVR